MKGNEGGNGTDQATRNKLIECPNCEGSKKEKTDGKLPCQRCSGKGRVKENPDPTNVIQLPKKTRTIPREIAKAARDEFKAWKRTFMMMINQSQIEFYRDKTGAIKYTFVLSPELCKTVYEVQIKERVRAQKEMAIQKCREKGILMPTDSDIEKIALASLQQEFMAAALQTMKFEKDSADQARDAAEAKEKADEDEEAQAAEELKEMRAKLVGGTDQIESAEDRIKEELEKRKADEPPS